MEHSLYVSELLKFVSRTASLVKDGECPSCRTSGYDDNPECQVHSPYDLENDDAFDDRMDLIDEARDLLDSCPADLAPSK